MSVHNTIMNQLRQFTHSQMVNYLRCRPVRSWKKLAHILHDANKDQFAIWMKYPRHCQGLNQETFNHYNNTGLEVGQQCCLYYYNISSAICFFSQAIKQWHCIISYLKSRHCCYIEFTEKEKGTRYSVKFPQKWEQLEGCTYLGHQQTGGMIL